MHAATTRRVGALLAVGALFAVAPPVAGAASVTGVVNAAGRPLTSVPVTLRSAGSSGAETIGHAVTDARGRFSIAYTSRTHGVLYLDAGKSGSALTLRTVVGSAKQVTVDELTTVAAGYALAQFTEAARVSGPDPGLANAASTFANLADPRTGAAGGVVTDTNNGSSNDTLATLNTLANLVSLCATPASARCHGLLVATTPPGGGRPVDTVEAIVDLARNPTLRAAALFALARKSHTYGPALAAPPRAWTLVLLYTQDQLYASGRIAIDSQGNAWSSNNWQPGTKSPSGVISVLSPIGQPLFGSPISGAGMKGGAWGAAIGRDGDVWMGSFGGDAISQYSASGKPLSPAAGWTNGGLSHPQGLAVDQKGNVWIANNYGPKSAPGQGNVVVYPAGDPSKAITITGGGLNHPFAIQIDGYGRAWVTNAGPGGAKLVNTRAAILVGKFGGSLTVINPDFKPASNSPIQDSSFKWPLGLAIDSHDNAWTANYFSSSITQTTPSGKTTRVYRLPHGSLPWSTAIDGSNRVWVAGFGRPVVWLLCGADTGSCPPGSAPGSVLSPRTGFASKAFQHFTSVQLDQAGNVWLSNNWSQLVPPVGGVGIAEIVGAATPVCAPLQPLPARPAQSGNACRAQTAAPLPASLPSSASSGATSAWVWIAIGAGVLLLLGAVVFLIRRRATSASA